MKIFESLETIVESIVEPAAEVVDREAQFPRPAARSLGRSRTARPDQRAGIRRWRRRLRHHDGHHCTLRDARAASGMAPTSDLLFDFIGKAACGLPLF
ncbi:hypothetical protein sS8_5104 [Methylocaldum marinum]|uniref:Uncharacterized protein n=1 Tax=Methylocaldum marinum TaxID=1432792 RepID=A0A250KZT2_9GAMM|nr:hypothetical protein sS8_5104 [Methylocaldum marinum]